MDDDLDVGKSEVIIEAWEVKTPEVVQPYLQCDPRPVLSIWQVAHLSLGYHAQILLECSLLY